MTHLPCKPNVPDNLVPLPFSLLCLRTGDTTQHGKQTQHAAYFHLRLHITARHPCTCLRHVYAVQEALIRKQVEAYAADPSAGASKGQSSIQIRRDWKAKEKQLQVGLLSYSAAM